LTAYGIAESTSSSIAERITYDKSKVKEILRSLGDSITSSSKFFRLGKNRTDASRPLKIIFNTKELALCLFNEYIKAKRFGMLFPQGFKLTKDKIALERILLRSCHKELDNRTKNGEVGLRILFHNGLPNTFWLQRLKKSGISQQPSEAKNSCLSRPANWFLPKL